MKKKPKTIGRFLTKKYITTSLLLLVLLYLLVFIAQFLSIGTSKITLDLCAEKIVRPDYTKIDTSTLEDVGGWLEILDENNNVVYTKGTVAEKKAHYTQKQLLEMDGLQSVIQRRIYKIGPLTFSLNRKGAPYIATFASFKGLDDREYICIAKLPQESVLGKLEPTFRNFRSSTLFLIFKDTLLILIPVLLIFIFCLKRYSKSVKEHLIAPNTVLINGLRTIKNGDYSKKIHMNAEYEYVEIEDSFNHMARQLEEAEQQRVLYEKERQLLFANMAHDLRTPITTIHGSAKAVADGLVSEDKLNQTMETIITKTNHMNELVNHLLVFSKLESPDYHLQQQKIDLSELLREVLLEHLDLAEKNQIDMIIDLTDDPLEIFGDPIELRRVFDNLIGNSIQHNSANTTVQIRLYPLNHQVILEIKYNGNPIPKELQEPLFEPFVSGDGSRTTKNGSGLGLAISKKIVEKHGGKISFVELNEHEKMFRVIL